MPSATDARASSSSSAPAVPAPRARRMRRFTREQLRAHLEILADADLGDRPSPAPQPRLPSAASGKRKAPAGGEPGSSKRPRLHEAGPSPDALGDARRTSGPDPAPSEPAPGPSTLPFQPLRRPRRMLPPAEVKQQAEKYGKQGSMLKSSGDARHLASYPPNDKHHIPLSDPPERGSEYHIHGSIISRLESLDALVTLAYGIWLGNYKNKNYEQTYESWQSFREFCGFLKVRWEAESAKSSSESEKALYGLICMIDAFIHGRRIADVMGSFLQYDIKAAREALDKQVKQCYEDDKPAAVSMLPSPNPSTAAGSAASTPIGAHGASPAAAASATPLSDRAKYFPKRYFEPAHGQTVAPPVKADAIALSFTPPAVINLHDASAWHSAAKECAREAERTLTLPVLYKHFPRTFARMALSTLQSGDEAQLDLDDAEGELCWPGQLATGDSIGWVCLMGRAMIMEFGKDFGYKGVDGVSRTEKVQKLKGEPKS